MAETASRSVDEKPVVLFIDDDFGFIRANLELWRELFRDRFDLHAVNPTEPGANPVSWISDRLAQNQRLDAIYVDERIPGGNGLSILSKIRIKYPYLPVVMMSAFPEEAEGNEAEARRKGAVRFTYKNQTRTPPGGFLREVLLALPQLRDQAEDSMWVDLIRKVGEGLTRLPVKLVVNEAATFLSAHFGKSVVYVREHADDNLHLMGSADPFNAGAAIAASTVPYLSNLLQPEGPSVIKIDALTPADLGSGRWMQLRGWRLIGVPLIEAKGARIGTLTLYREPHWLPFRHKDSIFLQHLGLQLAAIVGAERALHQIRNRQTQLAQFVQHIYDATTEKAACELLATFLHEEVNGRDHTRAKTTVRLLEPGRPTIPRVARRGIPPQDTDSVKDIYQGESVCARVIRFRRPERGSAAAAASGEGFVETVPGMSSYLTVPLLASESCLGAVNLEHRDADYYNDDDLHFTEALTALTAHTLVRLKAQRFVNGIVTLVTDLVSPTFVSAEDLLVRSFSLLHDFTGYARLLYLVPHDDSSGPWQVVRVFGDDGLPLDAVAVELWRSHIETDWHESFLRKTLFSGDRYTANVTEMVSDESLGVKTEAMDVIHLRRESGKSVTGIVATLMLLPSGSAFEREQLNSFSRVIASLLETKDDIKRILDAKGLAEQEAVLGRTLGQFQHSLRTRLGLLAEALDDLGREHCQSGSLSRAVEILKELYDESDNTVNFVKLPMPSTFMVSTVWNTVCGRLAGLAQRKRVSLRPFTEVIAWTSDLDIVGMILGNLVQNAIEEGNDRSYVELIATVTTDSLILSVRDSGPGVKATVRSRLFETGVTTKPSGTGFGLHFSRLRAYDLGGDLTFDEDYRDGASFSLKLPANLDHLVEGG